MKVIYNSDVRAMLCNYEKQLTTNPKYKISKQRRKEKVNNFRSFLQTLGNKVDSLPICNKKDLGQIFDNQNNPIDKLLKQTSYKDESKFIWAISIRKLSNNRCVIFRVRPGTSIKESYSKILYEKIMRDVSKNVKMHIKRL